MGTAGIETLTIYSEALNLYQEKDYKASLEKLAELEFINEKFSKASLLKAYIFRDNGCYLEELGELTDLIENKATIAEDDTAFWAETWSLTGAAFNLLGESDAARQAFLKAVEFEPNFAKKLQECSNAIFVSNHSVELSKDISRLYELYNNLLAEIEPFKGYEQHIGPLRLGILSADLHAHPIASLLTALFRYHEKERVQLYVYSATQPDGITAKLKELSDCWHDVRELSAKEIAEVVHGDGIDILLELGGHTANNLLPVLAYCPAPVQMSGIGYMGTTGLKSVDYFIGDRFLDSGEESTWFSEKIIVLPKTHFCYTPLYQPPLSAAELPCTVNGYLRFGCFNNLAKVTSEMLIVWRQIMEQIPQSMLVLKSKLHDSENGRDYMRDRLKQAGIDISRVELQAFSADYLKEYQNIDIALDTYPYTGGQTTLEALYMGVPVISRYGERHGTRFGYSILCNCGLSELTAKSDEEYIAKAVALAKDKELLGALHKQVRLKMEESPIMNGVQWTKDFTDKLEEIKLS